MKAWIPVATFDELAAARVVQRRFEEAGLQAEIEDDTETQRRLLFLEPRASARVLVTEENVDRAERLLGNVNGPVDGLLRCPNCQLSRIDYPQMPRTFPLPLWGFALLAKVHLVEPEFFCEACKHTWPSAEHKPEQAADVLGWPVT